MAEKIFFNAGKKVKGYDYPVLNERAVRATAGLMFLIGIITFYLIKTTGNYVFLYFTVILFWVDFLIKVFIGPHLSPLSFLGSLMVKNQKPEWVGAIQKRFAWSIGFLMATTMIVVAIVFGVRGWLPLSICGTCLAFMWLESALGFCVGCKLYPLFLKWGLLSEPKSRPNCPGGICEIKN
ncbi:MAG: DUF4395 domain-containing protein [Nanoarchaeota archaeon]